MSEMVVARRLRQRRQSEYALIRRAPDEPCFGVQLAGNKPDEMAWAAKLVESRGADFIDVNLGCPIDHFTRMGLGAALARQPNRVARIVGAMRAAVTVPVTVKIRLGWNKDTLNYLELAKAAVEAGAAAVTVHGRTREARYRQPADWDRIAEIAAALPVPVIGNGDILFAHDAAEAAAYHGCAAVMDRARRVDHALDVQRDSPAATRTSVRRAAWRSIAATWRWRSSTGATTTTDALGCVRSCAGTLGFWCRYAPRRADGSWPAMQQREGSWQPRSPLESWLARTDDAALDAITDQLLRDEELSAPPAAAAGPADQA
jgi:hypothetical protein